MHVLNGNMFYYRTVIINYYLSSVQSEVRTGSILNEIFVVPKVLITCPNLNLINECIQNVQYKYSTIHTLIFFIVMQAAQLDLENKENRE